MICCKMERTLTESCHIPPLNMLLVNPDRPLLARVEKIAANTKGNTMLNYIKNFAADESGAVTVDWVVLTAAIVGLGIAVLTSVSTGAELMADNIEAELGTAVPDIVF